MFALLTSIVLKPVSIPHRYGKNSRIPCKVFCSTVEFPFLIGTVRTQSPFVFLLFTSAFPFLIGTVRTFTRLNSLAFIAPFPFLIGTVRTKVLNKQKDNFLHVSIPHRYGKNK